MKIELKQRKYHLSVSYLILLAQIAFIVYMNFANMKYMMDYDSSCSLVQAMEIWNQKKVIIDAWGYMSNVNLDSLVLLVAGIYGLTGNILISQAIANNLFLFFFIYIVFDILRNANIHVDSICMGIMLYLVPYSLGQLGYMPMLFTGATFYSVRVLLPLLLIDVMLEMEKKSSLRKIIFRFLLLVVIAFFAGLSSGVYVLLCGVMPVLLYEIIEVLNTEEKARWISKKMVISCGVIVIMLVGMLTAKFMGLSSIASSMTLSTRHNWIDNITSCFVGVYELFGGIANDSSVKVISLMGVEILSKWIITTFILVCIVAKIFEVLKNKKIEFLEGMCLSIIIINFLILTLSSTTYGAGTFEYRYHLIPMTVTILLVVKFIDRIKELKNQYWKNTFYVAYFGIMLIAISLSGYEYFNISNESNSDELELLDNLLEESGVETAIIMNDDISDGRKIKVFAENIEYITVTSDYRNPDSWGASKKVFDNMNHEGKIALVTTEENFKKLPVYLKNGYTFYAELAGKRVYIGEESKFDFISSFPNYGNESIDYAYSPGYISQNASITEDGKLRSNGVGGYLLYGPYVTGIEGTWEVVLNYKIISNPSNEDAIFDVTANCGYLELGKTILDVNKEEVIISNVCFEGNETDVEIRVIIPDGMIVEVESIKIRKK